MADSAVTVTDAGGITRSVDTHTQPNGDHREAVVIGDPVTTLVGSVLSAAPAGTEAAVLVRQTGTLPVAAAATPTRTAVAAATTSVQVWASTAGRLGGSILNESTGTVYLSYAATSAVSSADVKIPSGGLYELPVNSNMRITSAVSAIWSAAATGTLRCVEWV